MDEVARIVDLWLQQPNVRVLAPGDDYWLIFRQMLIE